MAEGTVCSPANPCTAVQRIQDQITNDRAYSKERMDKMDKVLDRLEKRLPLWATLLISSLTMAVGLLYKGG